MSLTLPAGMQINAPILPGYESILTPEALDSMHKRQGFAECGYHYYITKDGTIHHMVATMKDISELRDKELKRVEELRENIDANKSKTMMLQNMTHEIRTPLNAMFGFSQLLCMPDTNVTEEQKLEYFNYKISLPTVNIPSQLK